MPASDRALEESHGYTRIADRPDQDRVHVPELRERGRGKGFLGLQIVLRPNG